MNNTQIQIVPSMDNISQLVKAQSIDEPVIELAEIFIAPILVA